MKKIISILISFALIISSITSLAALPNYLEEIQSADFSFKYELKFNESLSPAILLMLQTEGIDTKFLENLSFTFTGEVESFGNSPKAKLYIKLSKEELLKVKDMIIDSFGEEYIGDYELWFNMDFTDRSNLVYDIIAKIPTNDKYYYIDLAYESEIESIDMEKYLKTVEEEFTQIIEELESELEKVEVIEEYDEKSGDYKLVIPSDSVHKSIKITVDYIFKNFDKIMDAFINSVAAIDEDEAEYMKMTKIDRSTLFGVRAIALLIVDIFKDMDIFREDAIVIKASNDKQKNEVDYSLDINIQTNIIDAALATTLITEDDIKAFFGSNYKKEDFEIDFTYSYIYKYENINNAKVNFPTLTEENSIDVFELQRQEQELMRKQYEINKNFYIYVDYNRVMFDTSPFIENGTTFVPIRMLMNALGVNDDDITYDDGVVRIKNEDTEIELIIGNTFAKVNGEEVQLLAPPVIKEDRTYVPLRFISENLGYFVEYEQYGEEHFIYIESEDPQIYSYYDEVVYEEAI